MGRYEQSEWGEFEKHVHRVVGQKSLFAEQIITAPSFYTVSMELKGDTDPEAMGHILQHFFMFRAEELEVAKMQLKKERKVECKRYTKDVAETKIIQVMDYARTHKQPIQCMMRKKQG